jgi:hypothetical protein
MKDAHRAITQLAHHHFSNEIPHYLLQQNPDSKVKYLAFSPRAHTTHFSAVVRDGNGHVFPDYYYVKGEEYHRIRGPRVVSLPVTYRELEDLGDVTILGKEAR